MSPMLLGVFGYALLGAGTFAIAVAGRYYRTPVNQESDDFIGVALVCWVLTTMVGAGLIAVVHFAFGYGALAGSGIVLVSLAAAALVQISFWRMLGVDKMGIVRRTGADAVASNDDWTPPVEPDQPKGGRRSFGKAA
jgi:hypothetical protein